MVDERAGNRLAQALVGLAVLLLWAGLMIVAVDLDLRHAGTTFGRTPLDAPAWVGGVLAVVAFGVAYVGKRVGVRYGTYPPERGLF